ncbi:MAG: NirD/YgiW/YdeI family stress tolerance protein [Methylococcales bacterium]|nr:NirD/YgiW/YdeI family stress tolerance protein [Methylococcales bacterium]
MTHKLSTLLFALAFSTGAYAEFVGPGATSSLTTVKSIGSMKDDDKITLEGFIIKETRSEHYTFKDSTGEIEVEIDNKDFRGLKVTPKTKIRIVGEVDKDWTSTTVDADYLEIVK